MDLVGKNFNFPFFHYIMHNENINIIWLNEYILYAIINSNIILIGMAILIIGYNAQLPNWLYASNKL